MTCVDLTVAAPNALGTATWYDLVADPISKTGNNVPFPLLDSIWRGSRHRSGRGGHGRRRHCEDVTFSRLAILLEKCKPKFKHRYFFVLMAACYAFLTTYEASGPFQ